MKKTKSKLAKKYKPEWEWQPIRNGKGHYWFLKPKYNRSERRQIMKNLIDPKNPHTVGKSAWNLGNHVLVIMFIAAIVFVVYASY